MSQPSQPGETRTVAYPEAITATPANPERGSEPDQIFERGACLGRYVVLSTLGSGGMGQVLAAYDPELDRRVALKVLHHDLLVSADRHEAQERLLGEARAAARLVHENVVSIFDVGRVGECLFIAMEMIDGQTLAQWLAEAPRPWHQVLEVFLFAGRGLAAAHRQQIVHLDFKPGNVMLTPDGESVRVLDFGLARAIEPQPRDHGNRASGESTGERAGPLRQAGTPAYMAPEQFAGGTLDARTDQFSFCLSLYRGLFDTDPFGDSDRRVDTLAAAPADSDVPQWLRQVIARGLETDPARRFPSMDALLEALDKARLSRWRASVIALALLPTLLFGALFAFEQFDQQLCDGAERKLAGIWDGPRRNAAKEAFGALDQGSKPLWTSVAKQLDRYSAGWVELHTELCEATHRRGEQSTGLLDRQMACLDHRLLELEAVTDLLLAGEPEVLGRAPALGANLGNLAACADRATLVSLPNPPATEEARRTILRARQALARARAEEAAGHYATTERLAREALAEAQQLGYRPLEGEARFWLGMAMGRLGQWNELRQQLLQAASLAQATRHDELLARALTQLIVSGSLRGDSEDSLEWAQLAGAAIERLGGRADLEGQRQLLLGFSAIAERRFEDAVRHSRTVLEVETDLQPHRRSIVLNNLGIAQQNLGRYAEALTTYRQALDITAELYGESHPDYAGTLANIAQIHQLAGDIELALAVARQTLASLELSKGPENPGLVPSLATLGETLFTLDRCQEAVVHFERALTLLRVARGNPAYQASLSFGLAQALSCAGENREQSRELVHTARAIYAELGDRYSDNLTETDAWLREHGDR